MTPASLTYDVFAIARAGEFVWSKLLELQRSDVAVAVPAVGVLCVCLWSWRLLLLAASASGDSHE